MRRRSRSFHRRPPSQWVANYAAFTQGGGLVATELVGASQAVASVDPPILQRFTVQAVRGQILMTVGAAPATATNIACRYGIIVTKRGTGGAIANYDPYSQTDGGAPWLWTGTATFAQSTTNAVLFWNLVLDVNVRVHRRISEGEQLVLFTNAVITGAGASCTLTQLLRTLITRVA